ncbi:MAG: 2-hydroxyacyl-CoA dehydratase family protein, partial [Proteobacteria bacterium]|nr:2-hydroxyacyl-CoA dehydratase family protein [Pseudomonadota bacterium]MBU1741122.1 2-hydroxyacyl-CoA dehydratase family protein [Pseudomonadota bacterium]
MNHSQPPPRPLASRAELKRVVADYYSRLAAAARSDAGLVAWCSSIGPAELLVAMGFEVYYPENHGALLGATRAAGDLIPWAVAAGYSPDICSYLTSDVGAYLAGRTPLASAYGLEAAPRPDVLVFNNNQCREVQDWFMFYARELGVPLVGIKSPRGLADVKESHVRDVTSQLEDMIGVLEEISGRDFDEARLEEAVRLSRECTRRWKRVVRYAARVPAPMTFFDHCIHMAPAVVLRGRPEAVEYYDLLLSELAGRVSDGEAAAVGERFRLYWDGMPIWGRLRMLSDLTRSLGAAVVASTYCNSWLFEALDPQEPLRSMARASLECFNVRDEDYKEAYIRRWVDEFDVAGVIFHNAKTCPYNTNSRFGLPRRLE